MLATAVLDDDIIVIVHHVDHAVSDDPYAVLGVPEDASDAEVRRAYLELARRHHPDYFVSAPEGERLAAEARMRAVNDAWAVLGDTARRHAHDEARPRPFRPFGLVEDEADPRDQPDVPYRASPPQPRGRTIAPALLLAGAVVFGALATVMASTTLLGVAAALFLLSCVGFLVVPLLALDRAHRDEG